MSAIQVTAHGLPLSFQAQTACTLTRSRNSQVGDKSPLCHLETSATFASTNVEVNVTPGCSDLQGLVYINRIFTFCSPIIC
jgi:hypothetical protein